MNALVRYSLLCLTATALLAAAGCGKGTDKFKESRPETVSAEGNVIYKGKPVVGATVVLAPVNGQHAASGMTDSNGHVILRAFPPDRGAVPGTYNVSITLIEQPEIPQLPEGVHAEDVKLPQPKSLIPSKYGDPNKSGMQALIPAEGRSDMTFELTD